MELSLLLMKQILAMVLLMAIGYTFVRTEVLKEEDGKVLSKILLYAASPCIIVDAFLGEYTSEQGEGFVIGVVGAVLVHVVLIFLSHIAEKIFTFNKIEKTSLWLTNAGYILIPLVNATLGSEYVFYCCAFMAVQNVFVWTYLQVDLGKKQEVSVRKIILNPNILAIAAGIVIFYGQIKLPVILSSAVTNMGNATGALSMMVIGMAIGKMNLGRIVTDGKAYLVCLGRLVVYPLITIALVFLSGACRVSPVAQKVLMCTVLAAAAPAAAVITQFAELYDLDAERAGAINVLSVFLCIVTMPVMLWIYQKICL